MIAAIKKLILESDILGLPIALQIEKNNTYKTYLGSCATFTILIFLIYSFSLLVNDILIGRNPIITSKSVELQQNEGFTYSSDQFLVAIAVADQQGQLIINTEEKQYYNIRFTTCTKYSDRTDCTIIPSGYCGDKWVEIGKSLNVVEAQMRASYCINDEYLEHNPLRLQGQFRMENYTDITVVVNRCQNDSFVTNCAPIEEIELALQNSNVVYAYSHFQFNNDSDSQYTRYFNFEIAKMSPYDRKQIYIMMKYSQTTQENNLFYFFPHQTTTDSVEFSKERLEPVRQVLDESTIADINFKLESLKVQNFIQFPSILDVLAKLGGLFSLLRLVLTILIEPIQKMMLKIHLYDKLHREDELKDSKEIGQIQVNANKTRLWQMIFQPNKRKQIIQQFNVVENHLDIIQILKDQFNIVKQVDLIRTSLNQNQNYRYSDQRLDDYVLTPSNHMAEIQALKTMQIKFDHSGVNRQPQQEQEDQI